MLILGYPEVKGRKKEYITEILSRKINKRNAH